MERRKPMRIFRSHVLGAFLLALALMLSSCKTGEDSKKVDEGSGTPKHTIVPVAACDAPAANALEAGSGVTDGADVALLCSTQAVIAKEGWVVLTDDKAAISGPDNVVPVIRSEVVNDAAKSALNAVSKALTTEILTDLNARVEIDRDDEADVAKAFLTDNKVAAGSGGSGKIVVGSSSSFPENVLLAEIYAQVLDAAGFEVEREIPLDTREVSQPALESEQIDVKPEYLLTLLRFYDPDAESSTDPAEVAKALTPLLAAKKLEILDFSEANDTNALVVTKETADKYSLKTISDLADVNASLKFAVPEECPERPLCGVALKEKYGIELNAA